MAPRVGRIEGSRSPAGLDYPKNCQQFRSSIEVAQREYMRLNCQQESDEAPSGQWDVDLTETNTDLVQRQLSELAQQIIHVILACHKENDILEEESDILKNGLMIRESRLETEKVPIDSEVQGVGLMMYFQHLILEEICSCIHILKEHDIQTVGGGH